MPKQMTGAAGILRRDQRDFAKDPQGPQRDVLEIADGRRHDEQRSRGDFPTTLRLLEGRGVHPRILLYDWELGHRRMSRLGEDVLDEVLMKHARR
jgi:hypothetical protein